MNFKSYLLAALGLTTLCVSSCSDDDDTDYSKTDPRIRLVYVKGLSTTFVVNDVEHIIYNYDSLTCGTDVSKMVVSFYGYNASPSIEILKDGEWVSFANDGTDTVSLENLKIRATSEKESYTYEYTFSMRVHKFDVNAFNWKNVASLPIEGTIASGKAVDVDGTYCYFYTNKSGESYVAYSVDGSKWTNTSLDKLNYNWSSVSAFGSKAVALTDKGIAEINVADKFAVTESAADGTISTLLFELGSRLWAVGDGALYSCGSDLTFTKMSNLPSGFPTSDFASVVTSSGKYSTIGYIYGLNGSSASMWGLDTDGNLMQLGTSSNTDLPVFEGVALTAIDNEIGLVGGKNSSGTYQKSFYTSDDAGLTWTNNWHKELPGNIGEIANLSVINFATGQLLLVGGETSTGYTSNVWTATLKGSSN